MRVITICRRPDTTRLERRFERTGKLGLRLGQGEKARLDGSRRPPILVTTHRALRGELPSPLNGCALTHGSHRRTHTASLCQFSRWSFPKRTPFGKSSYLSRVILMLVPSIVPHSIHSPFSIDASTSNSTLLSQSIPPRPSVLTLISTPCILHQRRATLFIVLTGC